MSNLYQSLGPQGRALLSQNGPGIPSTLSGTPNTNSSPQELDFLINELRNPKPDTTINKVLGYLYNYIPYIRHEHNLRLVIASFLNCPVCFGGSGTSINSSFEFEKNYLIIEVVKLIIDKKLKISMPVISIKQFYTIILKELQNFQHYNPIMNSWKILPIITGILLSNELRDQLYTEVNFVEYKWFFANLDKEIYQLFNNALPYSLSQSLDNNINYLSLMSLALVFKNSERHHKDSSDTVVHTKNISNIFMIQKLTEMIFLDRKVSMLVYQKFFQLNPHNENIESVISNDIMNKPVVKHLNKLSFLLEHYFSALDFTQLEDQVVGQSLIIITNFNKHLNHETKNYTLFNNFNNTPDARTGNNPLTQNFWFTMKNLLFSQIIIFQGILSRFLTANSRLLTNKTFFWFSSKKYYGNRIDTTNNSNNIEYQYKDISLQIMTNLYYINFILLSIGQGGFDNYNFVYYLTIELALTTGVRFEKLTLCLMNNYQEINMYPDVLNSNYIDTSKILFVLGVWENYFQQMNRLTQHRQQEIFNKEIYNIVINLVDAKKYANNDLLEASHSVLLFYFANNSKVNLDDVMRYVELVLEQFPQRISATQLSIAIETIGKKILSNPISYNNYNSRGNTIFINSAEKFFIFLLNKYSRIEPGVPIKPKSITSVSSSGSGEANVSFTSAQPVNEIEAHATLNTLEQEGKLANDVIDENKAKAPSKKIIKKYLPDLVGKTKTNSDNHPFEFFDTRLTPETAREATIVSLINLVPYFPLSVFIPWLNQVWDLIVRSDSKEQQFLFNMLWKVISESLDINRGDLAIRWWYEEKQFTAKQQKFVGKF
ncbi:Peroxisomal biogenesis factor 8 [Candida albicans]|uniref:Pex8p n=1 Tax=Candida albicans (strain SC5314 / ATCC MYA-2876) TaxID=237561 RepID=A0A1D8PJT4_CANAL|nr:Pex8p [Candida albicans SC5314]AOW28425.1 Pex8p [Candida albicans SC5314]|eukprot:XP_711002.2 Pex8p [Candida albicans SC5314]